MDVKDILKFQMLSGMGANSGMWSAGNNTTSTGHGQSGLTGHPAFGMLMQCVMVAAMGSIEELLKSIPGALTSLRQGVYDRFVKDRISKTMDTLRQAPISERAIALRKRHFLNTLTMTRWFKPPDKGHGDSQGYTDSNEMVDAVLNVVAKMDNVPSLKLIENARMMITHAETPVQLTDDCYLKLDKLDIETDGSLIRVRIILMSNTSSASELAAYVRRLQVAYRQELRNALGDTVYYFDQKDKTSMLDPRGVPDSGDDAAAKRARVMNAPRELSFTRTPFHSNKLFSNTFGEQVREVESRVRFFCENRGWYTERGIPYQLGFLLSGPPGSGKTSAIRAIANHTKRHIINVNFASITTATQLKNLLFSERLSTFVDSHSSETQTLSIPIDQRLYVLEEIDAIGDIVQQRYEGMKKPRDTVPDELTLAEILTALDGTIECPGRMLIMTSNHPEYLDEALIRPGRIDVCVSFTRAPRALIVEMYESFFQTTFPQELVSRLPDMRMTPAEVGQCLFKHFGSPDPAAMCRCLCAAAESAHTESDRRRRLSARRQEQVAEKEARSFSDALLDRTMPAEDPQKPLMQTSKVHNAEGVCVTADVIEEALAYEYPRPDLIAEAEKLKKHNFGKDVQGTRGSLSLCALHREPDNQHYQFLESVRNNLPESFAECDNSSELATIVDAHVPLLSQTFQN
ncbi:hypothetical protein CVIRNUC_004511 [Coccomyxa viridis]|uniref:AAA+ ATPase domain-containing protein n=2 Tax=Coccomyxa viridis TaxID=1274662 RepID=A0AAV1I1Q5_9CHLO|nr:hypothetical protein CVIRNUC_004511 [Coccomyxa viridis]